MRVAGDDVAVAGATDCAPGGVALQPDTVEPVRDSGSDCGIRPNSVAQDLGSRRTCVVDVDTVYIVARNEVVENVGIGSIINPNPVEVVGKRDVHRIDVVRFEERFVGLVDPGNPQLAGRPLGSLEITRRDGYDICVPGSLGSSTSCTFNLFWDGSANGFGGEKTDGISIVNNTTGSTPQEAGGKDREYRLFLPIILKTGLNE